MARTVSSVISEKKKHSEKKAEDGKSSEENLDKAESSVSKSKRTTTTPSKSKEKQLLKSSSREQQAMYSNTYAFTQAKAAKAGAQSQQAGSKPSNATTWTPKPS